MFPGLIASFTRAFTFVDGDRHPGVSFSLSNPTLASWGKAKRRDIDLWNGDTNQILSLSPDEFLVRNVLPQIIFDFAAYNLTEPVMILFDLESHD
jgi:hypothetical protein